MLQINDDAATAVRPHTGCGGWLQADQDEVLLSDIANKWELVTYILLQDRDAGNDFFVFTFNMLRYRIVSCIMVSSVAR